MENLNTTSPATAPQDIQTTQSLSSSSPTTEAPSTKHLELASAQQAGLRSDTPKRTTAPAPKVVPPKNAKFALSASTSTDETDETDDYVDESAIDDDDDSSDWEDTVEESGKSSIEKLEFKRVKITENRTSPRSLITLMLPRNDRSQRHGPGVSQSVSAVHRARTNLNGPSMVHSPNDSDDAALMMMRATRPPPMRPINEIPRSSAQPIMTSNTSTHHQTALSPRTTRRNVLATELSKSFRRHMLWERSQETSTADPVLKRRHTSYDLANLKQYPEWAPMKKNGLNASWDPEPYTKRLGYHDHGW